MTTDVKGMAKYNFKITVCPMRMTVIKNRVALMTRSELILPPLHRRFMFKNLDEANFQLALFFLTQRLRRTSSFLSYWSYNKFNTQSSYEGKISNQFINEKDLLISFVPPMQQNITQERIILQKFKQKIQSDEFIGNFDACYKQNKQF